MQIPANSLKKISLIFQQKLREQYDEREIAQFLYILTGKYLGWTKTEAHLRFNDVLPEKAATLFLSALSELRMNKPVQYITGSAFFYGLELAVNTGVLIPRPETEELVDLVIRDCREKKGTSLNILDIGTGSGNIAVSLALHLKDAVITATDISQLALDTAAVNADRYGCNIRFIREDTLDPLAASELPAFDIIVSNPPYVLESERKTMRPNVLDNEPAVALFIPDEDPMRFNKAIAGFAVKHLVKKGILYLEINERFGNNVMELLKNSGFQHEDLIRDINGRDRFIKASFG